MGKQQKSDIPDKYKTASVQHYGEDGWRAFFTYRADDGKTWRKKTEKLSHVGWDKEGAKRQMHRDAAKAEANERLEKLNEEYREELSNPKPKPEELMSVAECVSQFIEQNNQLQRSTRTSYEGMLKNVIAPTIGKIKLEELTKKDVEKWEKAILKKYSRPVCSNSLRLLKATLSWAEDDEQHYVERNVAKSVKLDKPEQKVDTTPNALTDGELARVVMTVNSNLQTDDGYAKLPCMLAIKIALYTGLRRGEICGLQWGDIDYENNKISVRRSIGCTNSEFYVKSPKSDSSEREVKCLPELMNDLRRRQLAMSEACMAYGEPLKDTHYVLGYVDGSFLKPPRIDDHWRALASAMCLKGTQNKDRVTFHCLRHTYATNSLLSNEYDLRTTAKLLGHSDPAITLKRYASTSDKLEQQSVNNLGARYEAILSEHANDGAVYELPSKGASKALGA